jgi:hypothetical protein
MTNANQPLDHPYTLRNSGPYLLEAEYHRMIESDKPRSYIFPRPCFSEVDSSQVFLSWESGDLRILFGNGACGFPPLSGMNTGT